MNRQNFFYMLFCVVVLVVMITVAEYTEPGDLWLWQVWGVPRIQFPFFDNHAIIAAADCNAFGYNVFLENPCDALGRVHVYSRVVG